MLVEPAELLRLLALPADSRVDVEPLSASPRGSERVAIVTADGGEQVVLVRGDANALRATNNLIVLDSLTREGFPYAVKLLAMSGDVAIESWPEGVSALQLVAPHGAILAAMRAFAALHSCKIYDGFSWGSAPSSLLPPEDLELHRLGILHDVATTPDSLDIVLSARGLGDCPGHGCLIGASRARHRLSRDGGVDG